MDRRRFVVGAASLVLAPRAFAKARVPVVLVTADEESRLVVVDLAGGRVLRHVPTLASPRSIETVGETAVVARSEEHTSELQSRPHLVCRLLLEKKKRTLEGAGELAETTAVAQT